MKKVKTVNYTMLENLQPGTHHCQVSEQHLAHTTRAIEGLC